ncbi:MAG: undecaprenyl-diphosphate phosphatase [Epsilonproteobacteria bacterium]|nr:undecaprenyl-diphosphate phosphatase [Campylobacterota bacterium]
MDIISAIIIGIVEGFTEFLPISSTGHMIVVSKFLGLHQDEALKAYEVIIQFAAILAVLVEYRDKISFKEIELWKKVLVAFLPLLVVGYIFKDEIKALFDPVVVAYMFIIGGVAFLIVEYFYRKREPRVKSLNELSLKDAFIIGLFQLLSFIPGTSRAGSTIIGAMLIGVDRKTSAEFSFLLAIPVMGAVSLYDLLKHYKDLMQGDLVAYLVGFITAFVVAYLTIKLFLAFISKFSFIPFAIYRILFGLFLLYIF